MYTYVAHEQGETAPLLYCITYARGRVEMFEMLRKTFKKYRLDNSREISGTRIAGIYGTDS